MNINKYLSYNIINNIHNIIHNITTQKQFDNIYNYLHNKEY